MTARPDAGAFRAAAARFLTGVTVVTSLGPDGTPVGATVNSFTTVSTKPPTVLISLMHGRTWQAVAASGLYVANVLEAADSALCRHFGGTSTRGHEPAIDIVDGFPVLPNAIARFACRVSRSHDIADHTLFIGEVCRCEHRSGAPLAFYESRFRHGIGAAIEM